MRFPFVSRSAYDLVAASNAATIAQLREQLEDERRRSEHLTDTLVAMKLSGATIVRSVATNADGSVKKLGRAPRSDVQQAIDENKHASSNPRLRAHLAAWADKELRRDSSDENEARILNRLRGWSAVSNKPNDDDDTDDDLIALER